MFDTECQRMTTMVMMGYFLDDMESLFLYLCCKIKILVFSSRIFTEIDFVINYRAKSLLFSSLVSQISPTPFNDQYSLYHILSLSSSGFFSSAQPILIPRPLHPIPFQKSYSCVCLNQEYVLDFPQETHGQGEGPWKWKMVSYNADGKYRSHRLSN